MSGFAQWGRLAFFASIIPLGKSLNGASLSSFSKIRSFFFLGLTYVNITLYRAFSYKNLICIFVSILLLILWILALLSFSFVFVLFLHLSYIKEFCFNLTSNTRLWEQMSRYYSISKISKGSGSWLQGQCSYMFGIFNIPTTKQKNDYKILGQNVTLYLDLVKIFESHQVLYFLKFL